MISVKMIKDEMKFDPGCTKLCVLVQFREPISMEGEWNYIGEVGTVHFLESLPVQEENVGLLPLSRETYRYQDSVILPLAA